MATIKFKGHGTVETDFIRAKEIQSKWEAWLQSNRRADSLVKVGNFTGRLSQIDFISLKSENEAKDQSALVKRTDQEFFDERKRKLALSPEERGKETSMFKFMYYVAYRKDPPENVMRYVEKLQCKYFEKFPNRTVVNPFIFKEKIFPDQGHFSIWDSAGFRIVERNVQADIIHSK